MFSQLTGKREQLIIMWIKFRHLFFSLQYDRPSSLLCAIVRVLRCVYIPSHSLLSFLLCNLLLAYLLLLLLSCSYGAVFCPWGLGREERKGRGRASSSAGLRSLCSGRWEGGRTALQSSSPSLMKQSGMDGMPDVRERTDGRGGGERVCLQREDSKPRLCRSKEEGEGGSSERTIMWQFSPLLNRCS